MYVEAFTQAKDPNAPAANEDRWLAHESRLFAVIDGVTDKSGEPLPDGTTRGQAAGRLLDAQLRELAAGPLPAESSALVATLTDAIANAYKRAGIEGVVEASPNLRFGAQLVAAFVTAEGWRLVAVGDCGARVTRCAGPPLLFGAATPHDDIAAIWRANVFEHVLRRTGDVELALEAGRAYALAGNRQHLAAYRAVISERDQERLGLAAAHEAHAAHPDLDRAAVDEVLRLGIARLGRYRNQSGPLGFAVLDGTAVHPAGVTDVRFERAEVESIELFSDGYFGPPPGTAATVAAWERHIRHVEATDPHKVGAYRSTKGSSEGKFADDRTVMIVRQEAGA